MYEPKSFEKPKPKTFPKVEKEIEIPKQILEKSKKIKVPTIVKKEIIKEKKIEQNINKLTLDFFNQQLSFSKNDALKYYNLKVSKEGISDFWEKASDSKYKKFIEELKVYKKRYALNDWAVYLIIHSYGKQHFKKENKANLYTWFILTKMGYDMRVGFNGNNIYLLSRVKQKLYQVSFFTMDNKKYYVLSPKGRSKNIGSIYTYPKNYPMAKNKLTFDMKKEPIKIYSNIKTKKLEFEYKNKHYSFLSEYSKDLIEFYKTFPQSEYELYFDSKKSPFIYNSLIPQLKPIVENMSELEATNFLLRLVQKSFEYQRDDEQFSYEKVLFPEETLYYPYSDCEDRSIIFSYLIENLLGLDVIGVKFKDHLATAVKFSNNGLGTRFQYNGAIFTIADPTYTNANVGMIMPQYKNKAFSLIP
jgi:hypothetical protein